MQDFANGDGSWQARNASGDAGTFFIGGVELFARYGPLPPLPHSPLSSHPYLPFSPFPLLPFPFLPFP